MIRSPSRVVSSIDGRGRLHKGLSFKQNNMMSRYPDQLRSGHMRTSGAG